MQNLISTIIERMEVFDSELKDDASRLRKMKVAWENGRDCHTYKRETGTGINTIAQETGIVEATLQRFVRFYRYYPKGYEESIGGKPLMWGHYMAVLYLRDVKERQWYLEQAAANEWSTHELRRRVRNNFYESASSPDPQGPSLSGEPGPGGAGVLNKIDQKFYTYSARVLKVVDADTLTVEVDVGFSMRYETKLRLRGINAAEKGTKLGDEAKGFVEMELGFDVGHDIRHQTQDTRHQNAPGVMCPVSGVSIVIKTYKSEKYGRFLADVWYLRGESDPEVILAKGKFLNQVLLDNGYAQKVE